ncbi:hypothetical protein HL658_33320 [Azospirillum sp. RWY-5-1]|uniref:Uncharacterized protein n=1 Tax=Azospirillum oleiclasticum TaxID=2735135 RepID=A0ABX2TKF8_9PROT|nr:hypothetical protein [Azospirillum oleiclasticum]NYZ17450.1 hypothetical protein [Azospirillum oleiclasticum]NYZ24827.1 hypothetical protein [Azospirillum oleiclasticum]
MSLAESVWLALAVKALAAATVVVLSSLAAERLGPFMGGVITTLPFSTGPAYVLLAMAHDDRFIADSALSSLVAVAALVTFLVSMVWVSPRFGLALTLLIPSSLMITVGVLLTGIDWTLPMALLLMAGVYAVAFPAVRNAVPPFTLKPVRRRWYDIPGRALMAGLLVATVTTLSDVLGPTMTGALAIYPVSLTGLTIVLHRRQGGAANASAMRSSLIANPGFTLCVLTVHLLAVPAGTATALLAGLGVAVAWSVGVLVWNSRRNRPPAAASTDAAGPVRQPCR